jgi:hypothetical protein
MNTGIKYFLAFGSIAIVLTMLAINYVDSLDQSYENPDSYTTNTSEIRTANGHVVVCVYRENEDFVYVVGCQQQDK